MVTGGGKLGELTYNLSTALSMPTFVFLIPSGFCGDKADIYDNLDSEAGQNGLIGSF